MPSCTGLIDMWDGSLRVRQRVHRFFRRTGTTGDRRRLIVSFAVKERRYRRPDFIRPPEEEVPARREINQLGVRNDLRGLSGVGQRPVQIVGRADE